VAYLVGEPQLSAAIALEDSRHAAHAGAETGGAAVSRSLQSSLGLATGTVIAGVALGGLLGIVTALARGRFGAAGPRAIALTVAGVGCVAVQLVPFWAYPANPPGVGDPGTLVLRTQLYTVLLAISVLAAVAALAGAWGLLPRWGGWYAGLTAAGGYLAVISVALLLLPAVDEVPADYPASLLYRFRAASLLTQVTLWAALGLALAELTARLDTRTTQPAGGRAGRGA